ncbi:unnamed protein product, partial [Prunus armeniaca]
ILSNMIQAERFVQQHLSLKVLGFIGGQAADCFKREWECGMQIDVFGCSEVSLGRRAALADT